MRRSRPTLVLLGAGVVFAGAVAIAIVPGLLGPPPAPSPTAPAGPVAEVLPPPGTALGPGRYTMQDFLPRITFEIDEAGWSTNRWGQGFLDLSRVGEGSTGIGLAFARPTGIYSVGFQPVPATTSTDAAKALGFINVARLVDSSDSLMDGHQGKVVELELSAPGDILVAVLQLPGEGQSVAIGPGDHLWVAFFDTPDGLLAIVVDASIENLDSDLRVVEPILESVTIGR